VPADHGTDDDSVDINLRAPDAVAARMVVLAAVVKRALLELPLDNDENDESEGDQFDLAVAVSSGALKSVCTPTELDFVQKRIGELGEEESLAAFWQIEAIAALLWSAQLAPELPDPWVQADSGRLLAAIPDPWDDLTPFAAALALRTDDEIAVERERAELWTWRSAIENDFQSAQRRERQELSAILRDVANEIAASDLVEVVDRDLAVQGQPFRATDAETKALIEETATQRLRALNWLCGFGESWDTVPLEI
jgi:hypothetical protein